MWIKVGVEMSSVSARKETTSLPIIRGKVTHVSRNRLIASRLIITDRSSLATENVNTFTAALPAAYAACPRSHRHTGRRARGSRREAYMSVLSCTALDKISSS